MLCKVTVVLCNLIMTTALDSDTKLILISSYLNMMNTHAELPRVLVGRLFALRFLCPVEKLLFRMQTFYCTYVVHRNVTCLRNLSLCVNVKACMVQFLPRDAL